MLPFCRKLLADSTLLVQGRRIHCAMHLSALTSARSDTNNQLQQLSRREGVFTNKLLAHCASGIKGIGWRHPYTRL